jgi:hypothetical protein
MTGTVADLLGSIDAMRRYHIILFPCSTLGITALGDEAVLRNIRRYVNEGGKIYVTDASVGVADRAFPMQLQIGGNSPSMGPVDSIGTYDPITLEGSLTQVGQRFSVYYDSANTEIVDPSMKRWLGQQRGPAPDADTATPFNPASFTTYGNFNWIESLHPVRLGATADGTEVVDTPKVWAIGSGPQPGDGMKRPLTVSFQPTGCGRVMYSTYHTTGPLTGHRGLFAQERIMLYLVLELGVCSPLPEIDQ